jgi:L-iditol 2-dehydrogenase
MPGQCFQSKLRKAIVQPYKIPGYLKGQVDRMLNTVEGSRVVWPGPGRALLEPFQTKRPRDDEILVLTHATLVSAGTERAMFAGLPNTSVQFPFHPGYSGAGEILMVGEKVTRFKVGDMVAAGLPHVSLWTLKQGQATPTPQGVTMEQACFYQLGIIALQGVRKAQIQLGESVAVLGPGLIGQIAIQLVAAAGAYPITVVASSNRRLALAIEHGAHTTLNLAEGREALDGIQADVTIDVTGNPEAIHDAVRCTRPGGRIVLLGSNRGVTRSLDFDRIRSADLTLIGAHIMSLPQMDRSPGWWPHCQEGETILQFLADGRLSVDRLLTEEVFPPEAELFYRRLVQGDRSILGAIFRWDRLPETRGTGAGTDIPGLAGSPSFGRWQGQLYPEQRSGSSGSIGVEPGHWKPASRPHRLWRNRRGERQGCAGGNQRVDCHGDGREPNGRRGFGQAPPGALHYRCR